MVSNALDFGFQRYRTLGEIFNTHEVTQNFDTSGQKSYEKPKRNALFNVGQRDSQDRDRKSHCD